MRAALAVLSGVAASCATLPPTTVPNMNGEYVLSATPQSEGTQEKFPLNFKDYPNGVEHFDVYSPVVTSLYSQVYWTGMPPIDLPEEIVKKYAGKGMAVVGFECNQMRNTSNGGEEEVPINVAYNHHFESTMTGAKSRFEKMEFNGADDPRRLAIQAKMGGHGIPVHTYYKVHDLAPGNSIPTSASFGAANGGEYRKSFHGYAPGYVQVIESPEKYQFTPMQIDTWNRDKMNVSGGPFVSGPVPRNSLAPTEGPDALYSGLLECPVTTRISKELDMGYTTQASGSCANAIGSMEECLGAAKNTLGGVSTNYTSSEVNDASRPSGCSATSDATDPTLIHVVFNKATSGAACSDGNGVTHGATQSLVRVEVGIDTAKDLVTITLTGPSAVWFGTGFNASAMKDSPWAIIVDGTGNVTERKLQDQNPGTQLPDSVTVLSSTVAGDLRTVVVTRPLIGKTADYYTFNTATDGSLSFINAIGSTPTLSYHKEKTPSSLAVLPGNVGMCLCASKPIPFGQGAGKLVYTQTKQAADTGVGTITFNNRCDPAPRTDLLWQKNPTCDLRTYVGGQIACHHMFSLLDADQDIPWTDQPLQYRLKFRFWVQPYDPDYHHIVKRVTWGIASPVEYDVPKCDETIPNCTRTEDGNWVHTIKGTYKGEGSLSAAHFHCHAPTCLSMAMYRCPLGADDCDATTGTLLCEQRPLYGGSGKVGDGFNEKGFIAQPPCLWGDEAHGLQAPVNVSGYMLHTVKTSNATYGHHGEMAWQQMFILPDA